MTRGERGAQLSDGPNLQASAQQIWLPELMHSSAPLHCGLAGHKKEVGVLPANAWSGGLPDSHRLCLPRRSREKALSSSLLYEAPCCASDFPVCCYKSCQPSKILIYSHIPARRCRAVFLGLAGASLTTPLSRSIIDPAFWAKTAAKSIVKPSSAEGKNPPFHRDNLFWQKSIIYFFLSKSEYIFLKRSIQLPVEAAACIGSACRFLPINEGGCGHPPLRRRGRLNHYSESRSAPGSVARVSAWLL